MQQPGLTNELEARNRTLWLLIHYSPKEGTDVQSKWKLEVEANRKSIAAP
jgi:hypothetical protein